MQSIKAQIEFQVKGKDHTYLCEPDTSLPECYEALTMMRAYIYGRMKEEQEKAEECKKLEKPAPEEQKVE